MNKYYTLEPSSGVRFSERYENKEQAKLKAKELCQQTNKSYVLLEATEEVKPLKPRTRWAKLKEK